MKQLGASLAVYATDHDGYFPMAVSGDYSKWPLSTAMWSSSLVAGRYVQGASPMSSPADLPPKIDPNVEKALAGSNRKPYPLSYMPNAITDYGSKEWGYTGVKGLMPVSKILINGKSEPTSVSECEDPSTLVMLANGYRDLVETYSASAPGLANNEIDYYLKDFGGVYDQFIPRQIKQSLPGDVLYLTWRKFGGGSNFVRADTSAKFLQGGNLDDPKYWLTSIPR